MQVYEKSVIFFFQIILHFLQHSKKHISRFSVLLYYDFPNDLFVFSLSHSIYLHHYSSFSLLILTFILWSRQSDQTGRFIGLWATFQSLWQNFICPNLLYSQAIFVKMPKSLIFLVKSFLGNFYRHLAIFYWSHCSLRSLCSLTPFRSRLSS